MLCSKAWAVLLDPPSHIIAALIVCYNTMCRFLKILQLLVQDPANAGKEVLPSVVSFVMNQIYPIVAEVRECDGPNITNSYAIKIFDL